MKNDKWTMDYKQNPPYNPCLWANTIIIIMHHNWKHTACTAGTLTFLNLGHQRPEADNLARGRDGLFNCDHILRFAFCGMYKKKFHWIINSWWSLRLRTFQTLATECDITYIGLILHCMRIVYASNKMFWGAITRPTTPQVVQLAWLAFAVMLTKYR